LIIHNRNLTHLTAYLREDVPSYADLILLTLGKYSRDLLEFRFGPHPIFSDDALSVLLEECQSLQTIDIRGCPTITSQIFESMGRYGKELREVNLSNSSSLTLHGLINLTGCTKLRILDLEGIAIFEDKKVRKTIEQLFVSCIYLQRVVYGKDPEIKICTRDGNRKCQIQMISSSLSQHLDAESIFC
jgi:hypothetical protein